MLVQVLTKPSKIALSALDSQQVARLLWQRCGACRKSRF